MKILEKIIIPQDNVNDEKVIVKNIYVEDHSKIEKGDILIDYETSKANFELTASQSGYVKILINEGESVEVGKEIILIGDEKITDFDTTDNKTKKNIPSASKKALELIRENNLDSKVFSDFSLVTEKVVLEYLKTNKISNSPSNDNVYELSPNKLAEIDNLSNINRNGLVSYVLKTFDSSSIDTIETMSKKEFKGSIMILLIHIVSKLLNKSEYRHLNSYISDSKNAMVYSDVNFGVALNLGLGLKVGVIKKSNEYDINQLEDIMINLIDKYIDDKLTVDDVSGATIVLTNLTDQSIDTFKPLILKNNALMIGLAGKKNGIQNLIISFDHRITDGLEISKFCNDIIDELMKQYPHYLDKNSCFKCMKNLEEDQDLDSNGLVKILTKDKVEKYICITCLLGHE